VDQYRHIKRPLIAHAFGKRATKIEDGHLIMVASALAGEGKTFTCLNLALSMARERDVTVLLVDADVAKPHISRLFGAADQPGLLDVLDDPAHYDHRSVVMTTDVPGLALMPAGAARPHASELLASDRMEALASRLGEEDSHRVVLFDSPPLLQTSEARILAGVVGQIALVVCAGITPQHVVMDAIDTLHEGKAVNLILNQARYSGSDGYYGGYHVYGSYGGHGAEEARV
jgi:exopolysaccharide/PEP-CTERM locus tyrosine autokinase